MKRRSARARMTSRWLLRGLLGFAMLGMVASAVTAADKFEDLLKRIPEQCNAIALIDVDTLLDSPMGKSEHWREQMIDKPYGVLGASANASKVAMSASVDFKTLEDRWKVGMVQTRGAAPSLSVLASREGGYVDQIETENVAWTPRGLYLFRFDPRIVGFVATDDRQGLSRWIKNTITKPRLFPAGWYDRAVARANAGSPIVIAINLKDAISPTEAERWTKSLEDVEKYRLDPKLLGARLAGVSSALFQIDVAQTITGPVRVEFDGDITYAAPIAKEIVLQTLDGVGAHIEDMATWQASTERNAITLTGRLDADDTTRIARFLTIPHLDGIDEKYSSTPDPVQGAPAVKPENPTETDVVKASQRYYRSIVDLVNKLKSQKNQSFNTMRMWFDRTAGEIDELPILNVDTDLLEWGGKVSYSLREMAFGVNYSNKNRAYQVASSVNGSYNGYYNGLSGIDNRSAKTTSNAALSVDLDGRWKQLQTSIGEVRRQLVTKYKVEF